MTTCLTSSNRKGIEMQTPCDVVDETGFHHCPYMDTYMGYEDEMCRNCCGLGVDKDTPEREDEE